MTWEGEERRQSNWEIGRLTQAMETLTLEVNLLRTKVESIEGQVNRGKGVMTGLFLAAGSIGAGISTLLDKIFTRGT